MTYSSYRVSVPGKLVIAGDYAVLEPKQQAIVMAVNRYITATIEPCWQNQLSLPLFGLENVTWGFNHSKVHFSVSDRRLHFIESSIEVACRFLQENSIPLRPFHLTIRSELSDPATGCKYGLGSSAALVVAVISAILRLNSGGNVPPTLDQIFKLSAIAHLKSQKNGSGIDIAASTYGGWLVYSAFNAKWVLKQLLEGNTLRALVKKTWPNLSITPIKPAAHFHLSVGWTKESSSTAPMIKMVQEFRRRNREPYDQFLVESSMAVARLVQSFQKDDRLEAISSIRQNREALLMLSQQANIRLETSKLKDLCDAAEKYGSGKPSGAGGGDCGIAFMEEENQAEELNNVWRNHGITPLNLSVSSNGALVTEYTCEMSLKEYLVSV